MPSPSHGSKSIDGGSLTLLVLLDSLEHGFVLSQPHTFLYLMVFLYSVLNEIEIILATFSQNFFPIVVTKGCPCVTIVFNYSFFKFN